MITILTDPIPGFWQYKKERIKQKIRPILRKIDGKKPLVKPQYGGHFAVTRSLIEGLQKSNIPFVYNPQKLEDCTEEVIVLSGLNTLSQAIELRKSGKIKKLAAGPNLVILPSDSPELLGSKYLDILILNSEWIKDLYSLVMPSIKYKIVIWPAGVDEDYWKPSGKTKVPKKILFYSKRPEQHLYNDAIEIARKSGFIVSEIFYGKYSIVEYKKLLEENSHLVHFVEQESQGISLLEAWAMDVPTIVWNPGYFFTNGINVVSSSSPWITSETGSLFRDKFEFEIKLNEINNLKTNYCPRKWILENMTDSISSKKVLDVVSNFI